MTWPALFISPYARAYDAERARVQSGAKPSQGRCLHSSTFRLIFCTFCTYYVSVCTVNDKKRLG
jgi:hypothetical protein